MTRFMIYTRVIVEVKPYQGPYQKSTRPCLHRRRTPSRLTLTMSPETFRECCAKSRNVARICLWSTSHPTHDLRPCPWPGWPKGAWAWAAGRWGPSRWRRRGQTAAMPPPTPWPPTRFNNNTGQRRKPRKCLYCKE